MFPKVTAMEAVYIAYNLPVEALDGVLAAVRVVILLHAPEYCITILYCMKQNNGAL